jgi:hypothetical protein
MYIQRREMYDWGWRPPNGWHLIPFGLLLFLYIYISIPAFNWCWACWILLSPDGSHFKQQDQDGRPASSMKEWQLNRSAYTRGHTTADADGQHIGSWTRPAAAAVIQWLCRVFICFLLLFLFFLCVSFLISLLLMVQPRRNRKQKLNEENKSMAIQHRLRLSVPPLLGCRLSYVRVYILAARQQSKRYAVCVCIHFFFFFSSQQSCWMRHVLLSPSCYSPFVLEGIPSISIVYFVVSFLCCVRCWARPSAVAWLSDCV